MTLPVPSGLTSPLIVAVSWIFAPTVTGVTALVVIPGCDLPTSEVSPLSPHEVAAGLLFESPA